MLTCRRALWRGGSQQKSPGNWSLLPSVKVDWALRVQRCGTAHALLSCCGFILFKTDSIWVEWMHQNVIKDSTIWEIKEKQSHTWVFKQILRLRILITQRVWVLPGNGQTCRFWTDPWTDLGPLFNYIGANGPQITGIPRSAALHSLWSNGGWIMPAERSPRLEELQIHMITLSLGDSVDTLQWRVNGQLSNSFKSSTVYHLIREQKPQVPWEKVIWIKKGIPTHKSLLGCSYLIDALQLAGLPLGVYGVGNSLGAPSVAQFGRRSLSSWIFHLQITLGVRHLIRS